MDLSVKLKEEICCYCREGREALKNVHILGCYNPLVSHKAMFIMLIIENYKIFWEMTFTDSFCNIRNPEDTTLTVHLQIST